MSERLLLGILIYAILFSSTARGTTVDISQTYNFQTPQLLTLDSGPTFAPFAFNQSFRQFDAVFVIGTTLPASGFGLPGGGQGIGVELGLVYNGSAPLPPCCSHTESWGQSSYASLGSVRTLRQRIFI